MQLPIAMLTARSIRFARPIAMADPLSAAPPTIARNTSPTKAWDIPSASPVPWAAPTRTSLIQAARADAASRVPTARAALHRSPGTPCPSPRPRWRRGGGASSA